MDTMSFVAKPHHVGTSCSAKLRDILLPKARAYLCAHPNARVQRADCKRLLLQTSRQLAPAEYAGLICDPEVLQHMQQAAVEQVTTIALNELSFGARADVQRDAVQ